MPLFLNLCLAFKYFLVVFCFLLSLNEVCFTVIKLLFLQMESGGFGESITAAVSG